MTRFRKRLLNKSESLVDAELMGLAKQFGYRVYPKVRVADVLEIEKSGISEDLFGYAIRSHFDFVVSEKENFPLFSVEFDGPSHSLGIQKDRDRKKDELCVRFDFPILRINFRHLEKKYNKSSLLRWIVSAWELQLGFAEAQSRGAIPLEEDFDPIFFVHEGRTLEEKHPHWIALRARHQLERLYKAGRIPNRHTCSVQFCDENENYYGIEWIDLHGKEIVYVKSGMRHQNFPLYLGELFTELLTVLAYDKLITYLSTNKGACAPTVVENQLREMQRRYRFAGSHGGSTMVNFSPTF